MALASKTRFLIIGGALGVAVITIAAGFFAWTGSEKDVISAGATTPITAATQTTPTAATNTATTPVAEATAASAAVTTPPTPPASPSPSPEPGHGTACADSISIAPSPATADAPITVTVKVRGTTAAAVKVKYSRRGSGEPEVEKDLSPAGNEGTLAIWQATFNAPHNAADYDYYSWAIDKTGYTACGGPVGKTLTVHP